MILIKNTQTVELKMNKMNNKIIVLDQKTILICKMTLRIIVVI